MTLTITTTHDDHARARRLRRAARRQGLDLRTARHHRGQPYASVAYLLVDASTTGLITGEAGWTLDEIETYLTTTGTG